MEFQQEGYERKQIHGTDPQFLIEKIIRERIYDSLYWKEKLFASNAELLADRAIDLLYIGGQYGNQRPCDFLSCLLKLLQIQPENEIIQLFLDEPDFKYLTALGAFYTRLTNNPKDVYLKLEPLLLDKRKLRFRKTDGSFEITFMDQFVDDLLTKERVLDCILPRITKRYILEDALELETRISPLEELEEDVEMEESELIQDEVEEIVKEIRLEDIDPLHKVKTKYSSKKVKGLFKKVEKKKKVKEGEEEKPAGFKDGSLSYHETNILRANLGLKPLN
jgi:pre-mRNA-splicing factor 38A